MNIVTGHYALPAGDLLAGLYGLFIKPVYANRPVLPGLSDLPLCPPRLCRPGADALCTHLVYGRRVPVRHGLLGGLPLLDTRGGVYLVHAVHDIPALRGDAGRTGDPGNMSHTGHEVCNPYVQIDLTPIQKTQFSGYFRKYVDFN